MSQDIVYCRFCKSDKGFEVYKVAWGPRYRLYCKQCGREYKATVNGDQGPLDEKGTERAGEIDAQEL